MNFDFSLTYLRKFLGALCLFTCLVGFNPNLILKQKNVCLSIIHQVKKDMSFIILKLKKKNCDYKCLIYGSRPYFGLNCLQRQIKNNEAQFWETTIHLPNTFFLVPVLDLSTYNSQEISSHNNKKMEKLTYH